MTTTTPDGKAVAYTGLINGHHQLFLVCIEAGSKPKQLTHGNEEVYAPQISPDGNLIAVTVYTHTKTVRTLRLRN